MVNFQKGSLVRLAASKNWSTMWKGVNTDRVFYKMDSDGEVKRSEPVKLLYCEMVHYSKLFKTVHAVAILWS